MASGQGLSSLLYFFGISLIAHFISRRAVPIFSWQKLRRVTWPRICVLLIFLDSWLFTVSSGFLLFGIGLDQNIALCATGIYLCIAFYTTSKLLIYSFLIEKVYIVWSPVGRNRFRSKVYILCLATVIAYGIIIVMMVFGRVHYFGDDGRCIIGLKHWASLPLLSFDLYVNVLLTSLFLYPLFKTKRLNAKIKMVATRTTVAAGIALTTSTVNIAILAIVNGKELAWVCLASCTTDVVVNSFAIYWATGITERHTIPSVTDLTESIPAQSDRVRPSARTPKFTSCLNDSAYRASTDSPATPSAVGKFVYTGQMPYPPNPVYLSRHRSDAAMNPNQLQDQHGSDKDSESQYQITLTSESEIFFATEQSQSTNVTPQNNTSNG